MIFNSITEIPSETYSKKSILLYPSTESVTNRQKKKQHNSNSLGSRYYMVMTMIWHSIIGKKNSFSSVIFHSLSILLFHVKEFLLFTFQEIIVNFFFRFLPFLKASKMIIYHKILALIMRFDNFVTYFFLLI